MYLNYCCFSLSKNVPLEINHKYFATLNKEELQAGLSLFSKRKHLPCKAAKKTPPPPNQFAGLCIEELVLSLYKLQHIRFC